jgi:hypothetical protein
VGALERSSGEEPERGWCPRWRCRGRLSGALFVRRRCDREAVPQPARLSPVSGASARLFDSRLSDHQQPVSRASGQSVRRSVCAHLEFAECKVIDAGAGVASGARDAPRAPWGQEPRILAETVGGCLQCERTLRPGRQLESSDPFDKGDDVLGEARATMRELSLLRRGGSTIGGRSSSWECAEHSFHLLGRNRRLFSPIGKEELGGYVFSC